MTTSGKRVRLPRGAVLDLWRELRDANRVYTNAAEYDQSIMMRRRGRFDGTIRTVAIALGKSADATSVTLVIKHLRELLDSGQLESKIVTELLDTYGE